ncbi:glycerophosphoryl diester phosphodiesterase family domain-containing protein [Ditylenchus destructor]|uniref:Glycerophosphoryl diester phosphodiesterase family domain-containing protein n=1 Tax=Ditylenchus destructor TaxID=166010 RepID=A0AAD4MJJ2_9BILA|nr:glycerophosphoryl diester phosphodiesterase family domain-containing protein [Ditylenchus destructor]
MLSLASYWLFKNQQAPKNRIFFENFKYGGHRGSLYNEPENTIASMAQAKLEGADLVEFDVALTKDGVAVLLHDDLLDRTTNKSGPIREILFKDLNDCNAGVKFLSADNRRQNSADSASRSLPTLEEMVVWAKRNEMKMIIDVKDPDELMRYAIEDLFKKHDLFDLCIVCSFYPQIVYRMKRNNPRILTGITWNRWAFSYTDVAYMTPRYKSVVRQTIAEFVDTINVFCLRTWLPSFLAVDMVLTERGEICERFVRKQENAGRCICAWTVNDPVEMRWMRKTLKIPFLTDKPFLVNDDVITPKRTSDIACVLSDESQAKIQANSDR